METSMSVSYMFLKTAKHIWDFIERSYSKAKDEALTFELNVQAYSSKQGERSITEFGNHLQGIWQELDQYQVLEMVCDADAAIWRKFQDKYRAYVFLAGLNPEYDQIRVQILGRGGGLPSLEEIIYIAKAEESRRAVMLDSKPIEIESNALMTKNGKEERWCSHCKKSGHVIEKCWKMHGKPPSKEWNNNKDTKSRANLASREKFEGDNGAMTKEDLQKFKMFLKSLDMSSGSSSSQCSLALKGPENGEEDWTC